MISKQISTYEKKIQRAKEIISLREQRVKNNEKLIKVIEGYIKENKKSDDTLIKIKILELENQKIELLQSNLENNIAIRIQNEILNEDIAANNRLQKQFSELEAEINSGKWGEYVETIKQTAMNIRRRNPKADTTRLTNAVARSYEPFENDTERIYHFKVLKQLAQIKG